MQEWLVREVREQRVARRQKNADDVNALMSRTDRSHAEDRRLIALLTIRVEMLRDELRLAQQEKDDCVTERNQYAETAKHNHSLLMRFRKAMSKIIDNDDEDDVQAIAKKTMGIR